MSLTLAFQINRVLILHTFSQHHPPYILLYYADKNQTTYSGSTNEKKCNHKCKQVVAWLFSFDKSTTTSEFSILNRNTVSICKFFLSLNAMCYIKGFSRDGEGEQVGEIKDPKWEN